MKTIIVKRLAQTTFKPARVTATDGDHKLTMSVHLEPFARHSNVLDAWLKTPERRCAIALCRRMGWNGKIYEGDLKDGRTVYLPLTLDLMHAHKGRVCAEVIDLDAIWRALGDETIPDYWTGRRTFKKIETALDEFHSQPLL